ncbi:MAG TPA: thioredoxin domain-containing protein [Gemmatimonadaceae bacterium]
MKLALLAALIFSACTAAPVRAPDSSAAVADSADALTDSIRASADRARITGDTAAALWLIIASDFQCPYCAQWHRESHDSIRARYVAPGRIRIAYLNFPLEQHRHARAAANAALCAGAQNRFWEVHDAIFETQEHWTTLADAGPAFESLASEAGLDMGVWRSCVAGGVMDAVVRSDRERAASAGVQSTPTFLVLPTRPPARPGQLIRGAVPLAELSQVLDSLLMSPGGP